MAVEISEVTHGPNDDLITAAWLDNPRTGPINGYGFKVVGWVVAKAPVAKVEFVHEGSVVASCELTVSRPKAAERYGSSSSQVGFLKAIGTVGLAPAFTIEVRVAFQDGRRRQIAEIRGTQQLTATTPVEVSSQNACAPRLILAGHSHLRAIAGRAIVSESSELVAGPRGDDMLIMVGPGPKRDMSYFNTLADLAIGADVGILWNGNEHNTLYLFEAETPFDFLSAHVPKMNPSAQMKSQAAIRHRFQQTSFDTLDVVLKRLATGGLNRIALIGTPPPKGDNEALRALLQAEEFFVNWAAQLGHSVETVPFTDPYVRLKLWYMLQDMQAEEARIRGLMFIPVPKEVQDADGFLKREFWQDVTHANRAYGNVMYETVLQAFK